MGPLQFATNNSITLLPSVVPLSENTSMKKVIRLEPLRHRDANHVSIRYQADAEIERVVRTLPGRLWTLTHRCWYVPAETCSIEYLCDKLQAVGEVDFSAIK